MPAFLVPLAWMAGSAAVSVIGGMYGKNIHQWGMVHTPEMSCG